jgi:hypothetical protein
VIAAVLTVPSWLTGMTSADHDLICHAWARKHDAADLDRVDRLEKAMADARRAGMLSISFIDGLTDHKLGVLAEHLLACVSLPRYGKPYRLSRP